MMTIFKNLVLLATLSFAIVSCAPTMQVKTEGQASVALNKSALHYITPPPATATAETKNLYPMVVNAFRADHIPLTTNKEKASYVVKWTTETQTKSTRSLQDTSYAWNSGSAGLNVNGYDAYGNGMYGVSPTGPTYAPVIRTYNMQNFTISVWKQAGHQPVLAWQGSATASAKNVKDPASIINNLVARYGTNFDGTTEIKSSAGN